MGCLLKVKKLCDRKGRVAARIFLQRRKISGCFPEVTAAVHECRSKSENADSHSADFPDLCSRRYRLCRNLMRFQRRSCGAAAVFFQTGSSNALNPTETGPNFRHILFKASRSGQRQLTQRNAEVVCANVGAIFPNKSENEFRVGIGSISSTRPDAVHSTLSRRSS